MSLYWPVKLPPTQKAIIISMADRASEDGNCVMTRREMCQRTCLSKRAVTSAINGLESAGYLTVNRSRGDHSTYKISTSFEQKIYIRKSVIYARASDASRRAAKYHATPKWLTKEQKKAIADVYAEAAIRTAETGVSHVVDHIIPLRGKTVCGLHVPWNLRAITSAENSKKGNRLYELA